MKKIILKLVSAAGIILLGFGLLNAPAMWKRIKFAIHHPDRNTNQNQNTSEPKRGEPNRLKIPSLGVEAPLVEPEAANEDSYQKALQTGVVHFPGTAAVGELGNAYYFGHSSDFAFSKGDYKTVFALLPNIEMGAEIIVTNVDGLEFKYSVVSKKVVSNNDVSVLEQGDRSERLLSLQTSYPVGTALQRYVVVAKLIE